MNNPKIESNNPTVNLVNPYIGLQKINTFYENTFK